MGSHLSPVEVLVLDEKLECFDISENNFLQNKPIELFICQVAEIKECRNDGVLESRIEIERFISARVSDAGQKTTVKEAQTLHRVQILWVTQFMKLRIWFLELFIVGDPLRQNDKQMTG